MRIDRLIIAGLTLGLATPAAAQREYRGPDAYERGYSDWRSSRSEAISRGTVGETARANDRAAAEVGDGWQVDEDAYARDRAAYDAQVRAHGRAVARYSADYARRQRAYAMAMDDWRAQVDACDDGVREACYAPTPDPAEYW